MKTSKEQTETLVDLVFKDRNKEYGAYEIRRHYASRLNRATAISIAILLMSLAYPLIASYYHQRKLIKDKTIISVELSPLNEPPLELPPPPPPPVELMNARAKFFTPLITDDPVNAGDDIDMSEINKNTINPGLDDFPINEHPIEIPKEIESPPEPASIPFIVEEMPQFIGGEEARLRFLHDNLNYPEIAKGASIQGTVYIHFIIDTQGKVVDVTLLRGIGGSCDEEAIRVVKMMPQWIPGKQGGIAVKVQFSMPVKFALY
ncbi:MAG: energy transducer TonB [Bacteroidota bacterium]